MSGSSFYFIFLSSDILYLLALVTVLLVVKHRIIQLRSKFYIKNP